METEDQQASDENSIFKLNQFQQQKLWQNIIGGFNDYISDREKILIKQKLEFRRYTCQLRAIL